MRAWIRPCWPVRMTFRLKPLAVVPALSILSLSAAASHAGTIGVDLFVDGALVGSRTAEANADGPVPIEFAAADSGYAISGSALVDIDPSVVFGLTATNFSDAALPFAFTFLSP